MKGKGKHRIGGGAELRLFALTSERPGPVLAGRPSLQLDHQFAGDDHQDDGVRLAAALLAEITRVGAGRLKAKFLLAAHAMRILIPEGSLFETTFCRFARLYNDLLPRSSAGMA